MSRRYPQVKSLRNADMFRARLEELDLDLPFSDPPDIDALQQPAPVAGRTAANRFAILPMEGWDATPDGRPTDLIRRRWTRFGASGAGLVWGGEAVAVVPEGRANPHQLCVGPDAAMDLTELRSLLDANQVVGLQLTHSGRFALDRRTPRDDAILDARFPGRLLSDDELDALAARYVHAAVLAADAGFDFVDVKACHGYLLHELLSAVDRPGRYGGSLEHRTALLRRIVDGVKAAAPDLHAGVRLSAFDVVPHRTGADGTGVPDDSGPFRFAFGAGADGASIDLSEPLAVLDGLVDAGVTLFCITAGSPYYSPHVQRPAFFPPSDGYQPPEDPLVGVARLVSTTAAIAAARPELTLVGSGYSYLQEWLPHVAGANVRAGGATFAGIGRMALSYHDLPADVLAGGALDRRRLCRTFSDCTTAPRNGLVSGCWPLDPFYKQRDDRPVLAAAKRRAGLPEDET